MKAITIALPAHEYERLKAAAEWLGTTPEAFAADALERAAREAAEQDPAPPPER